MKRIILALLIALPFTGYGQMKVYTVAGSMTATALGDGGPATNALVSSTEGIWMDGGCNLYISDMGHARIRKVDTHTGIITTIAGVGVGGFSGDNGPATNAKIKSPYGLFADSAGNVFFVDQFNDRIRRVDATTGVITTVAGGGTVVGDGGAATNAQIDYSEGVYGDKAGNIYYGDNGRIRKVSTTGIITTIAGTGVAGLSGDNGPATNAQISMRPVGMLFDAAGNFFFADRGNGRIRKIAAGTGIITTVAGTILGDAGEGGLATSAQLGGPLSFAIDIYGNIIIGDNGNNKIKKVDALTGIITTIAGVGTATVGSKVEGADALTADIHPEFVYLDRGGNLYYSNFSAQVRKVVGLNPGLAASGSNCTPSNIFSVIASDNAISIFPNPVTDELTIDFKSNAITSLAVTNSMGQVLFNKKITSGMEKLDLEMLPAGVYFLLLKGTTGTTRVHFTKL